MQDIIVTALALTAAALILRNWLRRRAASVPPKCANCAVVTELERADKGPRTQRP